MESLREGLSGLPGKNSLAYLWGRAPWEELPSFGPTGKDSLGRTPYSSLPLGKTPSWGPFRTDSLGRTPLTALAKDRKP